MAAIQVTEYLERLSDVRGLSKMALRRVEHLYYKNDLVYGAMRKLVQQQQAATAQQTSQTQQEGSDEAVEAEDLDEEETEAKQVLHCCRSWLCHVLLCWVCIAPNSRTNLLVNRSSKNDSIHQLVTQANYYSCIYCSCVICVYDPLELLHGRKEAKHCVSIKDPILQEFWLAHHAPPCLGCCSGLFVTAVSALLGIGVRS